MHDFDEIDDRDPSRSRREVADQTRDFLGVITEELLDYLEFEEEFETFEPIKRQRGRFE